QAGAGALEGWVEQLRAMVASADSMAALRDQMLGAYGQLPVDDLVPVMEAGFALAALQGRFDVLEGK
ncbi:portal protein, partial [bacterium]|nr:portal protein [bacterium]